MTTGILANIAGFLLGAVLYGLLLLMAVRSSPAAVGTERPDEGWRQWLKRPLVWAAVLGLLWNVGAFLVYGFPAARSAPMVPALLMLAFTALGFLPAVVVQVVLTTRPGMRSVLERTAIAAAYVLSAAAAVLQAQAFAAGQSLPSFGALGLLTLGFLTLLPLLIALTRRARQGRAVWIVALALFGVSALHLVRHTGREAWWLEVLGHQGSLLLPVAILLRDYRFAFADIFLKRALALSLTVILVLTVHLALQSWQRTPALTEATLAAYLLALTVVSALVQHRFEQTATWLVDTVMLHRTNYEDLLHTLEADLAHVNDEADLLGRAERRIAEALGAERIETTNAPVHPGSSRARVFMISPESTTVPSSRSSDACAVVAIPTVEAPMHAWRLGRLAGERRLLSDDIRLLESAASLTGRRIDSLRVSRERLLTAVREQEMQRLATEAELRALRAQIDPHFLFNALTTIRYLIRTAPSGAETTLLRLTSLLRAVLRRTKVEFTTLGEEIELVETYLDIERARFEERLRVTIDVPASLRLIRMPSLLIQPLVENAVKHGIAPLAAGGEVRVSACRSASDEGSRLVIAVHDSGPGTSDQTWARGREDGVGLANVERRLRCHFGLRASFGIETAGGNGTTVAFSLPLEPVAAPAPAMEVSL